MSEVLDPSSVRCAWSSARPQPFNVSAAGCGQGGGLLTLIHQVTPLQGQLLYLTSQMSLRRLKLAHPNPCSTQMLALKALQLEALLLVLLLLLVPASLVVITHFPCHLDLGNRFNHNFLVLLLQD